MKSQHPNAHSTNQIQVNFTQKTVQYLTTDQIGMVEAWRHVMIDYYVEKENMNEK